MTQFIEAITDYYGTPKGNRVFINPNYIIQMEFIDECEEGYRNEFEEMYFGKCKNDHKNIIKEHYEIIVDLGNKTEKLHISLEVGNKLLSDGGIKL